MRTILEIFFSQSACRDDAFVFLLVIGLKEIELS